MKRSGPLRRKESLRDATARKQREGFKVAAKAFVARSLGKKTPLKKIAKSRRRQTAKYFEQSTDFLARPENRECLVCIARRDAGEPRAIRAATEIHHYRGRIGRLLTWEPGFIPSCRDCRSWPHDNSARARAAGVLAPVNEWNVYPTGDVF